VTTLRTSRQQIRKEHLCRQKDVRRHAAREASMGMWLERDMKKETHFGEDERVSTL